MQDRIMVLPKSFKIFENVRSFGGDQYTVQAIHKSLVDIAYLKSNHKSVKSGSRYQRTESVSMKVCCLSLVINFENAVSNPITIINIAKGLQHSKAVFTFNSRTRHFDELARDENFAICLGHDGASKQNLE